MCGVFEWLPTEFLQNSGQNMASVDYRDGPYTEVPNRAVAFQIEMEFRMHAYIYLIKLSFGLPCSIWLIDAGHVFPYH